MNWLLGLGLLFAAFGDKLIAGAGGGPGCRGRVTVCNGVIKGPRSEYRLTDVDKLWLARALLGEVSESAARWQDSETKRGGAAVCWAMAQNFSLIRGPGDAVPRYSSFTLLLKAYCQPINPKWASSRTQKCREHPAACTERHLTRRRRVSTATLASMPAGLLDLVDQWVAGQIVNPIPGMTDWHARSFRGARVQIAGNHFGVSEGRNLI